MNSHNPIFWSLGGLFILCCLGYPVLGLNGGPGILPLFPPRVSPLGWRPYPQISAHPGPLLCCVLSSLSYVKKALIMHKTKLRSCSSVIINCFLYCLHRYCLWTSGHVGIYKINGGNSNLGTEIFPPSLRYSDIITNLLITDTVVETLKDSAKMVNGRCSRSPARICQVQGSYVLDKVPKRKQSIVLFFFFENKF